MLSPLRGAGGTSPSTPPGRMGPRGQAQLCEPPRCAGREWRGNSTQMCDSGTASAIPCLHLGLDVPPGCSFASRAPRVPCRGAGGAALGRRRRGTRGDAPSLGGRQRGCEQPLGKMTTHGDGCLGVGSAGSSVGWVQGAPTAPSAGTPRPQVILSCPVPVVQDAAPSAACCTRSGTTALKPLCQPRALGIEMYIHLQEVQGVREAFRRLRSRGARDLPGKNPRTFFGYQAPASLYGNMQLRPLESRDIRRNILHGSRSRRGSSLITLSKQTQPHCRSPGKLSRHRAPPDGFFPGMFGTGHGTWSPAGGFGMELRAGLPQS